jgi:hypothetical protein
MLACCSLGISLQWEWRKKGAIEGKADGLEDKVASK